MVNLEFKMAVIEITFPPYLDFGLKDMLADSETYAPTAVAMMTSLPETVVNVFLDGQFTVKQTSGQFKEIWSDTGVESSIIKDSKSYSGSGIIGLTRKYLAVLRWTCIRHNFWSIC